MGVLRKRRHRIKMMTLQLTSLIDMFTIILVFLLMGFQAEDRDFVLHADVSLPTSHAQNPFKTAVNLAVSKDAVFIEGKKVYDLMNGSIVKPAEIDAGRIEYVTRAVKKAWNLHKREKGEEDIVVIQADKKVPYRTIHLIMQSAAFAGFSRFRLAIEKE